MMSLNVYYYVMCILFLHTTAMKEAGLERDRTHDVYLRIQKERETAIIKNRFLNHFKVNGAKIPAESKSVEEEKTNKETGTKRRENNDFVQNERVPPVIVVIGEQASSKRDKCLVFNVSKLNNLNEVAPFSPVRMKLWMYLQKASRPKRRKKKKTDNLKEFRENDNGRNKLSKRNKSRDKKRKRKKKGRRIKLFVTDGSKRLTTARMNIDVKGWYGIELPISRFPAKLTANDTFKLCFKCKRCRRYKLVLYRKDSKVDEDEHPKIPFIEFVTERSRSRRSTDVTVNARRHHHSSRGHEHSVQSVNTSCCQEMTYTQDITTWFPNILYPISINYSICGTVLKSKNNMPLLSQIHHHLRDLISIQTISCVPSSYETFSYLFIDNNNDFKTGDIQHLIPHGCYCQYT